MSVGRKILWVSDAHAKPDEREEDFDRFSALGWFILEERPDVIVIGGDLWDFPSLSIYDGSRAVGGAGSNRKHQGLTIESDFRAGEDALRLIMGPMLKENERHTKNRHKDRCYKPEIHFLMGNHEARLDKVPEHIPEMAGLITSKVIHETVAEYGIHFHRFLENLNINGVNFRHYFPSGSMGKAVGIKQAINALAATAVWGHTHSVGYDTRVSADGRRLHAVCGGCFKPKNRLGEQDWSGVIILNNTRDGDFEMTKISLDSIIRKHGRDAYKEKELRSSFSESMSFGKQSPRQPNSV